MEIVMENIELDESFWTGYEEWLDEQAARNDYERMMEI
jgi:hypothetical protein